MALFERLGPDLTKLVMEFAQVNPIKQRINSLIRTGWYMRPQPHLVFTLNGSHPFSNDYEPCSRVIVLW